MSGAIGLVEHPCGHQTPVRGRGGHSSRPCNSCQYVELAIGPRTVGGRYRCGYWNQDYTVVRIDRGAQFIGGWQILVEWSDGHRTCHATAWEPKRDRVIAE